VTARVTILFLSPTIWNREDALTSRFCRQPHIRFVTLRLHHDVAICRPTSDSSPEAAPLTPPNPIHALTLRHATSRHVTPRHATSRDPVTYSFIMRPSDCCKLYFFVLFMIVVSEPKAKAGKGEQPQQGQASPTVRQTMILDNITNQ
jgi:hypothetical protein